VETVAPDLFVCPDLDVGMLWRRIKLRHWDAMSIDRKRT
jgi:hypothetical protein